MSVKQNFAKLSVIEQKLLVKRDPTRGANRYNIVVTLR